MPRNAYTIIKDALEEHYCSHPEFFRGPGGAEMCPPLDDALQALEQIEEVCRESREIEAAARLNLLSEQQRLREAGAWLASAPPRKTEPTIHPSFDEALVRAAIEALDPAE